jgi:Bacterial Ig-like domain (group 3)
MTKLWGRVVRGGVSVVASVAVVLGVGCQSPDPRGRAQQALGDGITYEPDCNEPEAGSRACIHPTRAIIEHAQSLGYPYYIGHAEPTALFFSRTGSSGSNMQWKFSLPATDPAPAQDGSSVANFELYIALWLGLALCDPNSNPGGPCVAASDTNNPGTAGAAFLELQFYPPGSPFGGCSDTQWCVREHINTLETFTPFQNMNCLEPTTQQYLTTDGTVGGTRLLMNNGDSLLVTIKDTASGVETDVSDLTLSTSASMVASGANGFVHNANQTDCSTEPFDFHAMYATASPGQVVPWATLGPNVGFDFEIGHFELCGDASCATKPDGGDTDDAGCGTIRGVGGCVASDQDQDGVCYNANWADGTAAHPGSVILGAPDDSGVGPLAASAGSPGTYDQGYGQITFQTTEGTATAFYPFFTQAGTGSACRFNFGDTIPGVTTNDFGKAAQYGTTIDNPCAPGQLATTLTYNGQTSQDFHDTATLAATLVNTDNGTGVSGATIDFALGTQSCSGVTNGAGHASCGFVIDQAPGGYTVTASFAGDARHKPSSASRAFTVTREETAIAYTGGTTSDFDDPVIVSATLSEDGVAPLAGRSLTFTLAGTDTCTAITDASGSAACSITPSEPAGTYPLVVDFAGDAFYLPSTASIPFVVTREETTITSTSSLLVIAQNGAATLSATLLEDGISPIAGRSVTITLGAGPGAQSCSGVTSAAGVATCTIFPVTVGLGPQPITDDFAGDAFFLPSSHGQNALVFAFLASGSFVLGDITAAAGGTVTWWGAQWARDNQLSGGPAPDAFKGFAETTSEPPACGAGWTSVPGNSAPPPPASSIPSFMGVVVSSQITKSGNTISGDGPRIVVVQTDAGYQPNPGHPGTGTVVATFCP